MSHASQKRNARIKAACAAFVKREVYTSWHISVTHVHDAQQQLTLAVAALLQSVPTNKEHPLFGCEEMMYGGFGVWSGEDSVYVLGCHNDKLWVSTNCCRRKNWNAIMQAAKIPLQKLTRRFEPIIIATPWGERAVNSNTWVKVTDLLDPNYGQL
jgi:hypothetical protein